MKKKVLPLFFCFLWTMAMAQINCTSYNLPVPPGDDCFTAPPFCASYLNGYCSSNAGFGADTPGDLVATVGCNIENNQWLTFVPCESSVSFKLLVGNCGGGSGLEFAILQTSDCQDFTALSTCLTIQDGQASALSVNGLQVGATYYLMIDGIGGDTCSWKITTVNGVSAGGVLQEDITSGFISGPNVACEFTQVTYTATGPICLVEPANPSNPNCPPNLIFTCPPAPQKFSDPFIDTTYSPIAWDTIWHITPSFGGVFVNNDSIGSSVQIIWSGISPCILDADIVAVEFDTIIFLNDGIDFCNSICPDPDPCDILPLTVFVNGPPSPPIITGPNQICEGQSATFFATPSSPTNSITWVVPNGLPFTTVPNNGIIVPSASPGQYCAVAENFCGVSAPDCHNVALINIQTHLGLLQLCQDDLPYDFFGEMVTASGNYQAVLNSWQGCDSIVTQQITVLPAVSVSIVSSVGTNIPASGTATLDAGAGFASYHWNDNSSGQTLVTDQPGTYAVTVTSAAGCTATDSITLTQVINNSPSFNIPVAPADSCATAPPFCASYLVNYSSSNVGYSPDMPGNLASVIPCAIENNQWLQFVACSDSVQLVLEVNSCAGAMGLEFYILQTTDCQIFTAQSACHEIANGTTDTLKIPNLQSGDTYYLMVDGMGGDVCNWKVLATQGISDGATFQEDNTPGQVTGPTAMCAGGTATYTFTDPICDLLPIGGCPAAMQQFCAPQLDTCIAVLYDTIWHVTPFGTVFVNNDSMGLTVMVTFPDTLPVPPDSSMVFTISVELVPLPGDTLTCPSDCLSACGTIIPDSEPCGILPLNVTVGLPQNTSETQAVCPGNCVDFYGETFCQPGTFTVTDTSIYGCINTHELTLDWIQEPPPFITGLSENCNASGTEYTVSFAVIANGFVTVNGQPLNGINFTSAPITSGQPYNFEIATIGQCQIYSENVSGVADCQPCIGGTFDLGNIPFCPSDCFNLQGNSYCAPGSYQEQFLNPQTGCLDTYVFTLTEITENQLVVGNATEFCDASNFYYSVGFSIEDGTPPFAVNGNPISGNFYQSGLIPSGQPYAFTVTDAATCSPQQVNLNGSYNCACLNSPGTVALTTINQCEGEMASAAFNNDAVIGPGDLQIFLLHTGSSSSLGTVIGTNTTGSFGFVPNLMSYGTTYYISPAVGPDMGGQVDMSSACFGFSPGQPVVFYTVPSVEILPADTLTCSVNSLTINSLPSGGSGNFSYAWEGPLGFVSSTPYPTVNEGGAYLLLLTDNLTGCEAQTATAVASDVTIPVFTVTNGEINCQQANATLEAASQMNGVTYTWTLPTGDQMTGATISTNIPGNYAVTAMGTNGCIANAATFVSDNGTPPSLNVSASGSINCSAPTVELIASSDQSSATFTWTLPDATTTTGSSLNTSLVGSYAVVATTPNGCSTEATTAIAEGPDPELVTDVEATDPTCHGYSDGSIKVLGTTGGTAPYEYMLNNSQTGDFFPDLPAGDYLLNTTDANGCMGIDTVQLIDPQEIMVNIGDDQFINLGESVTLTLQTNITPANIVWYGPNGETWPEVSELTISPKESGRYTIVISDVSSCRSSDTTSVYVNGQGKVFIPNVFSPNGDNNNDVFMLFAGGDVEEVLNIQIFDRWGEMVFEDHAFLPGDAAHGWDGRKRDKAMDPAVFIVKAMVKFKDGTTKMVTGDVMLLR